MHIIRREEKMLDAIHRFVEQYSDAERYPAQHATAKQLLVLPISELTRKNIDRIIGNSSWTSLNCTECNTDTDALVYIGDYQKYESAYVELCRSCLRKVDELYMRM